MANTWLASGEIYGVVSAPSAPPRGSGKSLIALQLAIEQANMLNYGLCTNFDINLTALYEYAYYMRFYKFCRQIENGNIKARSATVPDQKGVRRSDLTQFIIGSEMVFILDEAGIFANSHNWQSLSDKFKADLALLRKFKIRLWWIAQYHTQVAVSLRDQTNYIIECSSVLKGSKKLGGASEIWIKIFYCYIKIEYEVLYKKRERLNVIKYAFQRFFLSKVKKFSRFGEADILAFEIYNSFGKIGDEPQLLNPRKSSKRVFSVKAEEIEFSNFCLQYDREVYELRRFNFWLRKQYEDEYLAALAKYQECWNRYKLFARLSNMYFGSYDEAYYRVYRVVAKLACDYFGIAV